MSNERILIRGVNWLGDAVMALPAIERLRAHRPSAHLSLLTAHKLADLFLGHPAIDRIIPFQKEEGPFSLARRLRGSFDQAILLPNSFRTALEVFLARIPSRLGYAGNGRSPLLTRAVPRPTHERRMHKRSDAEVQNLLRTQPDKSRGTFPSSAHHLHHYLHLMAALGANPAPLPPRLYVLETEREALRQKFSIPSHQPILGLNPGAEYGPAKRWPTAHFIEAARQVSQTRPCIWLIFGGPADRETAQEIHAALGHAFNLAGQTSLRELCAALSLCQSVLTNDTGPMHLAAAVGTRVVVPFGSTSPELTGPGLPGTGVHRFILGAAPCAPCFRRTCPIDFRCMQSISPKEIAEALHSS